MVTPDVIMWVPRESCVKLNVSWPFTVVLATVELATVELATVVLASAVLATDTLDDWSS
jgi:hypothetical protein